MKRMNATFNIQRSTSNAQVKKEPTAAPWALGLLHTLSFKVERWTLNVERCIRSSIVANRRPISGNNF
jgi:hypothetical protein